MAETSIEWTDAVWNPVRGCARVSPGCEHCYAERQAHRFSGAGQPYEGLTVLGKHGPRWSGRARFVPEMLDAPLRWKRPRRVFVVSMGDPFHADLTNEQIAAVFGVMAACPQHTFQVLTKRPERMAEWFAWTATFAMEQRGITAAPSRVKAGLSAAFDALGGEGFIDARNREALDNAWQLEKERPQEGWPLPNVWLGVSCEDQRRADERIPLLLQCPAAVRFVSAEPLLGPIDLDGYLGTRSCEACGATTVKQWCGDGECPSGGHFKIPTKLDWLIVGAESGRGARPMHEDWVRSIRDQCVAQGVAFFYKQRLDERGRKVSLPVLDGRQWAQMPEPRS